ncbi:MAG: TonB-dependent receptor [Candidatus Koribacter versatilis]|uniref:TonB-dependent receptor n=1 Tax=Candidatus Korobacter versatilis TaxID=658062 RepID=A0A932EP78_9BACT|nr:TonB-dependent receptor [Candidatus Koribacter versatilis]
MRCKTSIVVLVLLAAAAAQVVPLTGVVRDGTGAAVAGATVTVKTPRGVAEARTDDAGSFRLDGVAAPLEVAITKEGFSAARVRWNGAPLEVRMVPAHTENITVTAERTAVPLEDAAADVVLLSSDKIASTAAVTVDDALRQVPGFSLFRRSGSRVANPTAQGATLRGLGASGASRALVLRDGIPLNDPFGGWVYWQRVPLVALERAEVLRGGASHLYGSGALSGVVELLTARPRDDVFALDLSLGNEFTADGQLLASVRFGKWRATLAGDYFQTDGYILVDATERGAVDTPANTKDESALLTIERRLGSNGRVFATGGFFGEYRHNGTPLQTNRTAIGEGVLGADFDTRAGGFVLRAYGSGQRYNQTFSAIAPDRATEALTRLQRVPAEQLGGSAQWTKAFGQKHLVVAGFDAREMQGDSDELAISGGIATRQLDAGGTARSFGFYAQDMMQLHPRLTLTLGARGDFWRNTDGFSASRPLVPPGPATVTDFPGRSESAFSPSAALLLRASQRWSLTASAYRAFRAPTLNELYRGFRMGNILTLANEDLRAERLTGAEAGARFSSGRFSGGATFFWAEINRPVANVTLSVTPALITRQRQNLGQTRAAGFEVQGQAQVSEHFTLDAGYIFSDPTVTSFAADPALIGLDVPQVPRHTFTFQARYSRPRWTLAAQGRALSSQFDDDQNLLPLDRFFTLDAFACWRAEEHTELYLAAENVFGQRYQVGRTPVVTLGPPVLVRGGIRFRLARAR